MEKIVYRKTLDVHKNGVQFMLQGFETADNMSRVIEISLMASGDAIDLPLEGIAAVMYVSTPNAIGPSRIECDIKNNKIIYNVLPITDEGITTMQIKLIETSPEGPKAVLYSPKFAIEVTKSEGNVDDKEGTESFTLLEKTISKAKTAYDARITNFELNSDGLIKITYGDGSEYTSDFLRRLNLGDNAVLAESYAKGTTGARSGENTDNAQYYSNVAKSEALNARDIMENSEVVLDEVRKHGVYTAFSVDFSTGEVLYASPQYDFKVNTETGELNVIGKSYDVEGNLISLVEAWLKDKGINFPEFMNMENAHGESISKLEEESYKYGLSISSLESRVTPVDKGGTGASTSEEALANLNGASISYVDGKVGTYQYEGNGEYGKGFPRVIPYEKPPKMIVIQGEGGYGTAYNSAIMMYGVNVANLFPNFGSSSASLEYVNCTWSDKSLSFYNSKTSNQLNKEGTIYRCMIFY